MALCPNCGTDLNSDFGTVTCPSCRVISIIDIEGNVQIDSGDAGGPPQGFILDSVPPQISKEIEIDSEAVDFNQGESLGESEPFSYSFNDPSPPAPVETSVEIQLTEDFTPPEITPAISSVELPEPVLPDFDPEGEPGDFFGGGRADEKAAEDLSDIALFGNSEESSAPDGLFVFDVTISGIDSRELREAIRQSLDDKRFLWDVGQLMGTIYKGTLELRELNPVKATIIVNRLKGLPLDIQWNQSTIVNS